MKFIFNLFIVLVFISFPGFDKVSKDAIRPIDSSSQMFKYSKHIRGKNAVK